MPQPRPIATVGLALAAALCAGAALFWWLGVDRTEFYTDDGTIAASTDQAAPRDVLWRPPERLDALNTPDGEGTPRIDPADGTLYFSRLSPAGDLDVFVAPRRGQGWGEPEPLATLNTPDNEHGAAVSPDGAWLYFASDRPGGAGGSDLWRAPRTNTGWGEPEPLAAPVNTAANELHPAPDTDAAGVPTLLFASDRPADPAGADPAGADLPPAPAGFDLYEARLAREPAVERLAALSSPADDVGVAVSPSRDFVYFSSDRPGGAGGFDLYRARRTADGFGPVEPLGYPINTPAHELEPALAMEGFAILYATDGAGSLGGTDLRRSVSREVYLARGSRFAGLLGDLLALLPWLLAILALIFLLSMLRRVHAGGAWEGRFSTLGLMARCALASVLLHALLLALLAWWQVELTPGSPLGDDEGTRVSLVSGSGAAALGEQVRGGFTEAQVIRAEAAPAEGPAPADPARAAETSEFAARASAEAADARMSVTPVTPEAEAAEAPGATALVSAATPAPRRADADVRAPRVAGRAVSVEGITAIDRNARTGAAPVPDVPGPSAAGPAPAELGAPIGATAVARAMGVGVRTDEASGATEAAAPRTDAQPEAAMPSGGGVGLPHGASRRVLAEGDLAPSARDGAQAALDGPRAPTLTSASGTVATSPASGPSESLSGETLAFGVPVRDVALGASTDNQASAVVSTEAALGATIGRPELALPGGTGRRSVSASPVTAMPRATDGAMAGAPDVVPEVAVLPGELAPERAGRSPGDRVVFAPSAGDAEPDASTPVPAPSMPEPAIASALPAAEPGVPTGTPRAAILSEPEPGVQRSARMAGSAPDAAVATSATDRRAMLTPERRPGPDGATVVFGAPALPVTAPADALAAPSTPLGQVEPLALAPSVGMPGMRTAAVAGVSREPALARGRAGVPVAAPAVGAEAGVESAEITPAPPPRGVPEGRLEVRHAARESADGIGAIAIEIAVPVELAPVALGVAMPEAPEIEAARPMVRERSETRATRAAPEAGRPGTDLAASSARAELSPAGGEGPADRLALGTPGPSPASSPDLPPGLPPAPTTLAAIDPAPVAVALPAPKARLRLAGVVVDDDTGRPLPGARVRVDLIDSAGVEVTAGDDGGFEMGLDDVPDNIALAAFAEGYVPGAVNIAEDDLAGDGAFAEIRLSPFNPYEIAMEAEPRVHHLGNDEFTGRINSQFQRESEGQEIRFDFELTPAQLPPNVLRAEIVLLAKGVQLPNPVGVNGRRLATTLRESPSDGSFGEQRLRVPLELLRPGQNWIAIRSIRSPGTDVDDFEFVNLRIVFTPARPDAPM